MRSRWSIMCIVFTLTLSEYVKYGLATCKCSGKGIGLPAGEPRRGFLRRQLVHFENSKSVAGVCQANESFWRAISISLHEHPEKATKENQRKILSSPSDLKADLNRSLVQKSNKSGQNLKSKPDSQTTCSACRRSKTSVDSEIKSELTNDSFKPSMCQGG